MKSSLIAISLLLISSTALACESYENCLEVARNNWPKDGFRREVGIQIVFLEAIAYKLDEISKKLDK